jgi:hypothetical protein
MAKFICFFEKKIVRSGDSVSRYPIDKWNHHNFVKNMEVKDTANSNNYVEGWHYGLKFLIPMSKPDLWKFTEVIKAETSRNDVTLTQINCNGHLPKRTKKAHESGVRLKNMVDRYRRKSGDSGQLNFLITDLNIQQQTTKT